MRLFIILITIILCQISLAQTTKIKIKKDEPLYRVTLAGKDTGVVSLGTILLDKKLVIPNNKFKLKIYAFQAVITGDSVMSIYEGKSEKLPKEMIDRLTNQNSNTPIAIKITRLTAFNEFNETINLNEIDEKFSV